MATSTKILLATAAVVATMTSTTNALPFKDAKNAESSSNEDEGLLWKKQFEGDDAVFAEKDMWADTKRHVIGKDQLLRMAQAEDLDYLDEEFFELLSTDPDVNEALDGNAAMYVKAMKTSGMIGAKKPKNMDDLMGPGLEGGADKANFAETNAELQSMYPYPEEDLEFWLDVIAANMDEDPESQSIVNRIARGDLSFFDMGMETSRKTTDEVMQSDEDLDAFFAQAEADVQDDAKISEAYNKLLQTPNLKEMTSKNSEIDKMLKNEESFKKAAIASVNMNKLSTKAARSS